MAFDELRLLLVLLLLFDSLLASMVPPSSSSCGSMALALEEVRRLATVMSESIRVLSTCRYLKRLYLSLVGV